MKKRDHAAFRAALDHHEFKQCEFAALAKLDANTVNNWAKGRARIPALAWLFFDLLDARPEIKPFVIDLLAGQK